MILCVLWGFWRRVEEGPKRDCRREKEIEKMKGEKWGKRNWKLKGEKLKPRGGNHLECANVWMCECVNVLMCECGNVWIRECVNAGMCECANVLVFFASVMCWGVSRFANSHIHTFISIGRGRWCPEKCRRAGGRENPNISRGRENGIFPPCSDWRSNAYGIASTAWGRFLRYAIGSIHWMHPSLKKLFKI